MFDKNKLNDLAEAIVYVNLLIAFLAIIALYDQRKVRTADESANAKWSDNLESQLAELTKRVQLMEEQILLIAGTIVI